jgi:hypothetical protein
MQVCGVSVCMSSAGAVRYAELVPGTAVSIYHLSIICTTQKQKKAHRSGPIPSQGEEEHTFWRAPPTYYAIYPRHVHGYFSPTT